MALPINIDELINGKTIESGRLEFKKGWNPSAVIQSICAFANDINNWGGGYIVIGIAEEDGRPMLPPIGVNPGTVDTIQKELLELCHQLRPQYFPIMEAVQFRGVCVLLIWVPGGETRPYKAPDSLSKERTYAYYVRRYASTKRATEEEERDLLRMSAHVPFDDQVQQHAALTDLQLTLIEAHLSAIGSDLAAQSSTMPFMDLCRKMNIVAGPDEYLKPKNIGLLLFNSDPKQFFSCAQIDMVQFRDEVGYFGNSFGDDIIFEIE